MNRSCRVLTTSTSSSYYSYMHRIPSVNPSRLSIPRQHSLPPPKKRTEGQLSTFPNTFLLLVCMSLYIILFRFFGPAAIKLISKTAADSLAFYAEAALQNHPKELTLLARSGQVGSPPPLSPSNFSYSFLQLS